MNTPPIFLDDRRGGGLLDWVEHALRSPGPDLPIELYTSRAPSQLTARQYRKWLVDTLRENCHCPFIKPLIHANSDHGWTTDQETQWGDRWVVRGRVNALDLFGLDPAMGRAGLVEYRKFLLWIEDKLRGAGVTAGEVGLQWFRGGYRERGLEWYGLGRAGLDEAAQVQWKQDLADWEQQPWFANWKARNLAGLARVRLGPHCWFVFHHLRRAPDPYGLGIAP